MVRIAGGTRMIEITDIDCPGAPEGVRLRLLTGPIGADRRDLRAETRWQLALLAASLAGGEGALNETARGPAGFGAWRHLGMSLAYADHRALVAVGRSWSVGVDLLAGYSLPDWPAVAALYLGQADELARLPATQQPSAYAAAWTGLEADLKCLGLPLQEGWSPPDDAPALRLVPAVPHGVAALVLRRRAGSQGTPSPSMALAVSRSAASSFVSSRLS